MCFGGGGGGGTIYMPDTGAYDRQFEAQLDLMKMQQTGAINSNYRGSRCNAAEQHNSDGNTSTVDLVCRIWTSSLGVEGKTCNGKQTTNASSSPVTNTLHCQNSLLFLGFFGLVSLVAEVAKALQP